MFSYINVDNTIDAAPLYDGIAVISKHESAKTDHSEKGSVEVLVKLLGRLVGCMRAKEPLDMHLNHYHNYDGASARSEPHAEEALQFCFHLKTSSYLDRGFAQEL